MSEPRRVSLQPVAPTDRLGMGEPPGTVKTSKKKKKLTMRFNLDLGDPSEDACHEFNYIELVRNFKRSKPEAAKDGEDPFDSDDDVAAIAKKMEEKYGSGKVAWDDDVDKGQGYDEDDSFIDNGEAYDELVPLDLNTKYGGFYINTGDLEFVQAPPVQYMNNQLDVNKTKATLEDSPEDDSEEAGSEREPSPKRQKVEKEKQKRRKRKKIESDDSKDKDQGSGEKKKKVSITKKKVRRIESSSDDDDNEKDVKEVKDVKDDKKERLSMKQERQLDDAIEAVVRHARELNRKEVEEEEMELLRQQEEEMEREERENDRKRREKEKLEREKYRAAEKIIEKERLDIKLESAESANVKLPDRMPHDLENKVKEITALARESHGKSKFFQAYGVNETLLMIDMMARQALPCSQRTQLYCYLAAHLPCSKETLLKRVKKLRLDEEDNKVKEPMTRFRNELSRMVDEQVERYKKKCEEIGQKACAISDSEGEEDIRLHRKFEWTDSLRKLFREVVSLKIKTYEVSKLRATSAEDYVKNFFDIDMVILWPRGWMTSRTLLRMAHEDNLIPRSRNESTTPQVRKLTQLQNFVNAAMAENNIIPSNVTTPYRPRLNSLSSVETPLKDSSFKDLLPTDLTPTSTPGTSVIKEKIKEDLSSPPSHTPIREPRDSVHSVHSVISDTPCITKEERPMTPLSAEPQESPVHLSVITSSPVKHSPATSQHTTSPATSLPQVDTPLFRDSFIAASTTSATKKQSATPLLKANYQAALQKSPPFNTSLQAQAFAEFSQKVGLNYSQSSNKLQNHQTTSIANQYATPTVTSNYQHKYQQQMAQQQQQEQQQKQQQRQQQELQQQQRQQELQQQRQQELQQQRQQELQQQRQQELQQKRQQELQQQRQLEQQQQQQQRQQELQQQRQQELQQQQQRQQELQQQQQQRQQELQQQQQQRQQELQQQQRQQQQRQQDIQSAHQSSKYHGSSSLSTNFYGSQSQAHNNQSQSLTREKEAMMPLQIIDQIITHQLATGSSQTSNGCSTGTSSYTQQSSPYQNDSSHRSVQQNHTQQKSTQLPRSSMPSSYNIYEALQQQTHKGRDSKLSHAQPQQHSTSMANASPMLQHSRTPSSLEGMKGFPSPISVASSVPSYFTSSGSSAASYLQQSTGASHTTQASHGTSPLTYRYPWGTQSMHTPHQQRQYYQQQQDQRRSMSQQQRPDIHRPQ